MMEQIIVDMRDCEIDENGELLPEYWADHPSRIEIDNAILKLAPNLIRVTITKCRVGSL